MNEEMHNAMMTYECEQEYCTELLERELAYAEINFHMARSYHGGQV